jgi:glycosyltransferase involved in cell wall biosynthesis
LAKVIKKIVSNPMISVVIPTYNRAKDLRRCLDSLIAQDLQDFEVLICDDGSSDNTSGVVAEYTDLLDITYSYGENFGGPARPRNRGIALAGSPYIAFLDSDDWWTPSKLRLSLEALDAGADIVCHDLYVVTSPVQRIFWKKLRSRELKSPVFDDLLTHGNGLLNSSVVVRKHLLVQIGGASEDLDLLGFEDFDTWLRISKLTDKFKRIPHTLGYYWMGGGNISNEHKYIHIIQVIKKRYGASFQLLAKHYNFYWINFALGRYHFKCRNYNLAATSLGLIGLRQSPPLIYFKSQWMLFLIKCFQILKLIS